MARSPCSLTPVGQPVPDHFGTAVWPPLRIRRRRQHCAFRGSITPLPSSLCTLRRVDHSTTAQHSLPGAGQALPDRLDYLQGSNRRFQILHLIPLLQAWLGANPTALPRTLAAEDVHKPARMSSFAADRRLTNLHLLFPRVQCAIGRRCSPPCCAG